MAHTAEQLISAYVKMRDDRDAKVKEFEVFKKARNAQMEQITAALGKIMRDTGVDSLKSTSAGTAFKATKDFVGIDDWPTFMEFIARGLIKEIGYEEPSHWCVGIKEPSHWCDEAVQKIITSDQFAFFNKAVKKATVKEFMSDNDDQLPPGLNYSTQIEIQIRRPK